MSLTVYFDLKGAQGDSHRKSEYQIGGSELNFTVKKSFI